MLGIWYVIEKTSTASSCIIYNITETDEPGEYKVEEISQHFLLSLTPLKHGYHYTGTLKVPDKAVPARMTVSFPLSKFKPGYFWLGFHNLTQLTLQTLLGFKV